MSLSNDRDADGVIGQPNGGIEEANQDGATPFTKLTTTNVAINKILTQKPTPNQSPTIARLINGMYNSSNSPNDSPTVSYKENVDGLLRVWEDAIQQLEQTDIDGMTTPTLVNSDENIRTMDSEAYGDGPLTNAQPMKIDIEKERRSQLERRMKRKKKKKKKKDKMELLEETPAMSLDSLVNASCVAEQIFEKLMDDSINDGNPLLGIRVLLRLSETMQRKCYHLVHFPTLIVEYLLMTANFPELTNVLKEFHELRDNDLIVNYAYQALKFRPMPCLYKGKTGLEWVEQVSIRTYNKSASILAKDPIVNIHEQTYQIIWNYNGHWDNCLTGNEAYDEDIRKGHFYAIGSPYLQLGISLLNLCKPQKLAQNCIDLCDLLSQQMGDLDEDDHLLATNLIMELLLHAKKSLLASITADNTTPSVQLEERIMNSKVALVDSYIHDVDLLRTLLVAKCKLKVSLIELADKPKVRKLRDSLIKLQKLELALHVCTNYNIEPEPVWAAWGLALLQQGKYNDAKEKLKYCLTSTRPNKLAVQVVLQNIVEVLEMMPNDSAPQVFDQSSYDVRYQQCIYYLTEYGTPQLLIKFWLKHEKMSEVCKYVFEKKLPHSTFVDDVVVYCLQNNMLGKLQQAIKDFESKISRKITKEYLLSTCNYFNHKKDMATLLNFQLFMKDYARAGLTCIKLFVESTDIDEKKSFLEQSKTYLLNELQLIDSGKSDNLLTRTDINKYIKKLKLQQAVTTFIEDVYYKREDTEGIKNLSVFGPVSQRCKIAEHVLELGNQDLAVGIILNFQLPVCAIFINTAQRLMQKQDVQQVKSLLLLGKDVIMADNSDWDQFVLVCVKLFVDAGDMKNAESSLTYMHKDEHKIDGLIICGKLKTAYLLAVQVGKRDKLRNIMEEAKKRNMKTEERLCAQYLSLAKDDESSESESH